MDNSSVALMAAHGHSCFVHNKRYIFYGGYTDWFQSASSFHAIILEFLVEHILWKSRLKFLKKPLKYRRSLWRYFLRNLGIPEEVSVGIPSGISEEISKWISYGTHINISSRISVQISVEIREWILRRITGKNL